MHHSALLASGSSKNIFGISTDPAQKHETLTFGFRDDVSVFDLGPVPGGIAGLGKLRRDISVKVFQGFVEAGIPNHFIEPVGEKGILVKACSVPEIGLKAKDGSRIIPVEILFRKIGKKKFVDRVLRGEMPSTRFKLAFLETLKEGMRFKSTFVECSTKREASDRYISDEEAAELSGIRLKELEELYRLVRNAEAYLTTLLEKTPIRLDDGKFEAAIDKQGRFFICDSVSPDELGLSDLSGTNYDKNPLRDWYRNTYPDWYEELNAAKKLHPLDKSFWPLYPAAPPNWLLGQLVDSYGKVAKALGC